MQPIDPLSQLAMCCGLGGKRRGFKPPRNYFYSPSMAHMDPMNSWALASPYGPHQQQPQPYLLLTQPVIIAGGPMANQTSPMTMVQHAQVATQSQATGPAFQAPIYLGTNQQHQPNIVSSQYAIYSSTAAAPSSTIVQHTTAKSIQATNQMERVQPSYQAMLEASTPAKQPERRVTALSSEIFRQLEVIEKQIDLSKDMDLIERQGIVITRAISPYSLMPHLTEATLRRYHTHFLFSDNYVIRFIEIIKRPGQTLGLYIRTVQFEDPRTRRSRAGLVVTKIDSDSPIYNSQVLHVGDEILSVNLIDIHGVSLDDVVIIMSIPKRLVLALRIPKDRDQLLSLNLSEQQQQAIGSKFPLDHQRYLNSRINNQFVPFRDDQALSSSVLSRFVPVKNDTESMEEHGREVYLTRPARVQSAIHMNDMLLQDLADGSRLRASNMEIDVPRRYSSSGGWPQNANGSMVGPDMREMTQCQPALQLEPMEQQSGIGYKPRDDTTAGATNSIGEMLFPDYDYESRMSDPNSRVSSYPGESTRSPPTAPGTFPRRTLPTRPTMLPSSANHQEEEEVKQPVISSLRLGDTPEQSSYFSSSIDAINRELKELRRQRMALSNNEQAADTTKTDF